ncbi:MAG: NAD-binding protein [Caldilineales bacterium]|nr:NAD-binding protein [Caldilineales bacterium]MDW8318806.1 NAD-binding protein [Anaerolineae bacterium]
MFVIVAGGGRTGTQLAATLLDQGHRVRLIENRPEVLERIHRELPTEAIYEGGPAEPSVLEQAGIRQADVVAATTDNDANNLAICYMARRLYNVGRTIARINNPRSAWLFDEKFHVDAALNQADVMASLIVEEMSLGDMMTLLKLRRGQYSLVEEKIPPTARVVGQMIKDVRFPEQCVIAAIIRHGEIIVPRGVTVFEAGDEVLAVTNPKGAEQLAELFSPAGAGER